MKREKREKKARDYFELEPDERILREYIGHYILPFRGEPILLTDKQIYHKKGVLFRKPCKVLYSDITGISTLYSNLRDGAGVIYLFKNSGEIHLVDSYVKMDFKDNLVKNVLETKMELVPKKDISPEIRIRENELSGEIVKELHGDNLADLTGPGYYCGRKKGGQVENIFVYTADWIAGVSRKGDVAIPRNEILLYELERDLWTIRITRTTNSISSTDETGNKLTVYTKNGGTHEFVNVCGISELFSSGDVYKTESLMNDLYKTNGRPDIIKCKGIRRS